MDDNILYYIVLAVIYLVSRALKKKKPEPKPSESSYDDTSESSATPKEQPCFEDLFKQITGQEYENQKEKEVIVEPARKKEQVREWDDAPRKNDWEEYERKEPVYKPERVPAVVPEPVKSYATSGEDVATGGSIARKDLAYGRSEHFELEEEDSELQESVLEIFEDEDELRKAIVFKEVFDRRY